MDRNGEEIVRFLETRPESGITMFLRLQRTQRIARDRSRDEEKKPRARHETSRVGVHGDDSPDIKPTMCQNSKYSPGSHIQS